MTPRRQHNILEELNLLQHCCEQSKCHTNAHTTGDSSGGNGDDVQNVLLQCLNVHHCIKKYHKPVCSAVHETRCAPAGRTSLLWVCFLQLLPGKSPHNHAPVPQLQYPSFPPACASFCFCSPANILCNICAINSYWSYVTEHIWCRSEYSC
jgi:hypothetical protein